MYIKYCCDQVKVCKKKLFCRWKIHEACMLSLGSVKQMVLEAVQAGKVQFDVIAFLESVVLVDMNSNGMYSKINTL